MTLPGAAASSLLGNQDSIKATLIDTVIVYGTNEPQKIISVHDNRTMLDFSYDKDKRRLDVFNVMWDISSQDSSQFGMIWTLTI